MEVTKGGCGLFHHSALSTVRSGRKSRLFFAGHPSMGPLKCNGTQPSHYCSPTLLICFISRCCCIAKILELKRYFLLSHSQFSGNKIVEEKIQVFGKV